MAVAATCECGCGQTPPTATRTNKAKGHVKGEPVRFVRGHFSAVTRALIAQSKKGRPRDAATRAKISASLTGRTDPPEVRARKAAAAQRAEASPVWVGPAASYNTIHNRARAALPKECAHADDTCAGILEVAFRRDLPPEHVRTSPRGHDYYVGPRVEDGYLRLCRSHHRRYDQ